MPLTHLQQRPHNKDKIYALHVLPVRWPTPFTCSMFLIILTNWNFCPWQNLLFTAILTHLTTRYSILKNNNLKKMCDILLCFYPGLIYSNSVLNLSEFWRWNQEVGRWPDLDGLGWVQLNECIEYWSYVWSWPWTVWFLLLRQIWYHLSWIPFNHMPRPSVSSKSIVYNMW